MRLLIKRGSDGHPANRPGAMTVADAAAAGRNQVPLGIAYTVGSTVMFAGGNAVVKWQLATYPLGEVAVRAHPVRLSNRHGDRIAARRVGHLADATLPRTP